MKEIKYLDLFSGMGGFHKAASLVEKQKMVNVGAADVVEHTKLFYKLNYGIEPNHDIRFYKENVIEDVEMIFAGFPCQPFSSAGKRSGFNHDSGNLFWVLNDVIENHKPKYILLENVSNLVGHDNGNTWKVIREELSKNYWIPDKPILVSPDMLGHPELRKRVYIPGFRKDSFDSSPDFNDFFIRETDKITSLNKFKKMNTKKWSDLNEQQKQAVDAWNILLQRLNYKMVKPAWSFAWNSKQIIMGYDDGEKIVARNKNFYLENKKIIDEWLKEFKVSEFLPSYQKLEWNVDGSNYKNIYEGIIQFRPSGIRIKKFTTLPTMVALNQTPYIGPWKRFITPDEVAEIQGFGKIKYEKINEGSMFRMLGNNVNVNVTKKLIERMLDE